MGGSDAMSLAATPVRSLTIDEWYEQVHDFEGGRCELVDGVPP